MNTLKSPHTSSVHLFTDGGARGNPGNAGVGFVAFDASGKELFCGSKAIGKHTNNYAEYVGLLEGLSHLKKFLGVHASETAVVVNMDSELIVRQMNGVYKVKDKVLREKYIETLALASSFSKVDFRYIPREQNARADELANAAMNEMEKYKI